MQKITISEVKANPILKNEFIEQNIGLATKAVASLKLNPSLREDMMQVAYLWLCKCVDAFDISKGYEFSTYAIPVMRGRVLQALKINYSTTVRAPNWFYSVKKELLNGEDIEKVAAKWKTNSKTITEVMMICDNNLSLDKTTDSGIGHIHDIIADPRQSFENDVLTEVMWDEFLSSVEKPRYKRILELRLQECSERQIAEELGITRQWVSRKLQNFKKKFKTKFNE